MQHSILDSVMIVVKKITPNWIITLLRPTYHWTLSWLAAFLYGFPSKSLIIIGVTGTKGKSTTVAMITEIFEKSGKLVASVGSVGFKIKDKTWPNTLKMTMPGRFTLQKFLAEAKTAGVQYVIIEVTSEGIAQCRLNGIGIDCAVITNVRPEHIESHGSFEKYIKAKEYLFKITHNIHILNSEDYFFNRFLSYHAKKIITYGLKNAMINGIEWPVNLALMGSFNNQNALAALSVASAYSIDLDIARSALESIKSLPGRMEVININNGVQVIVDYAHTPDSLEAVYNTLRPEINSDKGKMICVLGAAGGGRDKWKRPRFGAIAQKYCDNIILTNEDPYDEDPDEILDDIIKGMTDIGKNKYSIILDRELAIKKAIENSKPNDTVIITGKGSEIYMALANNKKIVWSDKEIISKYSK